VSGRLAVRDATRNRGRTAPAVAAVMATVAGVTALAIGSASDSAQSRRDYQAQSALGVATIQADAAGEGWSGVAAAVRRQVPGAAVRQVRGLRFDQDDPRDMAVTRPGCAGDLDPCRWEPESAGKAVYRERLIVADAATVRALSARALPAGVSRALDEGRVVVFGAGAIEQETGTVAVRGERYDGRGRGTVIRTAQLPAVQAATPPGVGAEASQVLPAAVVVPPALAGRLPVPVSTTQLVVGDPGDPISPDEQQRISEAVALLAPGAFVSVERGWTDGLATPRLILFGLGAVLVLIATLTATGLALTDARPDLATLAAIGAAPRARRFIAMCSAAVIGGLGALLGLLVGMAPGIAVAVPLTSTDYGNGAHPVLEIPWTLLAGVAVAVPLLAVAVTGLAVRSRLPMARRLAA
jgi:putative ABC transport system permease protein